MTNEQSVLDKTSPKNIINSVSEFLKNIEKPDGFGSELVYRGQAEDWDLRPKIFRYETIPAIANSFSDFEDSIQRQFMEQSYPFINSKPESILEWLAIAQHYGTPTRLLDWTFSPLIALYFAIEKSNIDSQYGVVWALFTRTINNLPKQQFDFEKLTTIKELDRHLDTSIVNEVSTHSNPTNFLNGLLYTPSHINTRITAQQACLTIHTFPRVALNKCTTLNHGLKLRKFIIPSDKKPLIRQELMKLGITPYQIYPDLEGISKSIEWRIELASGGRMEITSTTDRLNPTVSFQPDYYWNPKTEQESRLD